MSLEWVDSGLGPFIKEILNSIFLNFNDVLLEDIKSDKFLPSDRHYSNVVMRIQFGLKLYYTAIPLYINIRDPLIHGVLRYRLERGQ